MSAVSRAFRATLEAATDGLRRVHPVAGNGPVPRGDVEAERLLLALARLEHDAGVAEPPRLVLERLEQQPAEAAPARLRHDVHPLQLGPRLVEAADAAARNRPAVVADDEEDAVGRLEHRRVARRPDVAPAVEAG